MLVSGENVVDWVMDGIGGRARPNATAIGWLRDGKLVAGHVFEGWNGVNVFTHVRIDEVPSKIFFGAISDYAFNTLKCKRVTGLVESSNEKAVRHAEKGGWLNEGVLSGAGKDGCDVIAFVIHPEQAKKWLDAYTSRKYAR